jgi:hypothetical protein
MCGTGHDILRTGGLKAPSRGCLRKTNGQGRPLQKTGHVVPAHPPVAPAGDLRWQLVTRQTNPYVKILSYSHALRRKPSMHVQLVMRRRPSSLWRSGKLTRLHVFSLDCQQEPRVAWFLTGLQWSAHRGFCGYPNKRGRSLHVAEPHGRFFIYAS